MISSLSSFLFGWASSWLVSAAVETSPVPRDKAKTQSCMVHHYDCMISPLWPHRYIMVGPIAQCFGLTKRIPPNDDRGINDDDGCARVVSYP